MPDAPKKEFSAGKTLRKFIIIGVIVIVLAAAGFVIAIKILLSGYQSQTLNSTTLAPPNIRISLLTQNIFSYSSNRRLIPYALIGYNATNVSQIEANVTIYKRQIPTRLYIL